MRDKSLATAVATLLAAFATAHLMQFGLSAGRAISGEGQSAPIGLATFVALRGETGSHLPDGPEALPAATHAPLALDQPATRPPPRDAGVPGALRVERAANGFGLSCDRALSLLPEPGAAVRVRVDAPCDPGVRVVLGHAGLRFAVETGADGTLEALVPVLTAAARVEVSFADGAVLTAEAEVSEAAEVTRVALVAEGGAGLTLHPRETAAWRGTASGGRTGALLRLGDPAIEAPLLAEVYTYPSGRFGTLGTVALRVEAALTPANCGRDVEGAVIRTMDGLAAEAERLRLSMPACTAEGDLLVLDLPAPALTLARK